LTSFALLFHEYATNAVKCGALSVAEGRLDITINFGPENCEIAWLESRARLQASASTIANGFGTTLEQMVARTLSAQVLRELRPQGLVIRLTVPRDAFGNVT